MSLPVEAALEAAIILLLALASMPLLRRQPAALRHGVLAIAMACSAAAPLASRLLPSWTVPPALAAIVPPPPALAGTPAPERDVTSADRDVVPAPQPAASRAVSALVAIWIAGVVAGLAGTLLGLWRLARLARAARAVDRGRWWERARSLCAESGVRGVELLEAPGRPLLMTWGAVRPKVLVPPGADAWPDDRIEIALRHELAHVRRRDWPLLLGAEILKAVYWFNPLAWLACARLRRESEQACDDAVIASGIDAAVYAAHLVTVARELKPRTAWLPAHGIARTSGFERRVRAMLDPRLNRRPVSRATYAALALALALTTAAVVSAQQRLATVTGSIADPTNGTLPGVTLVLTHVQNGSRFEVFTDAMGRYEFVGVPEGGYVFEARLPGFMTFRGRLDVSGQPVERNLTLSLGSLTETIVVRAATGAPVGPAPAAAPAAHRPPPSCAGAPAPDAVAAEGVVRVGGNLRAPRKIRDVKPLYPEALAAAGVEGNVVLQGCIGTDGRVTELSVATPDAHPDLSRAAREAVWQWEFTPTLLNGTPMPVAFTAITKFELERR